jgi:hypothetical protein
VSSYSHHMSPRLSGYSVHNISSYGERLLILTQCVLESLIQGLMVNALHTWRSLW